MLQTEDKYKIITFGLELHGLLKLKVSEQNRCIRGGKSTISQNQRDQKSQKHSFFPKSVAFVYYKQLEETNSFRLNDVCGELAALR